MTSPIDPTNLSVTEVDLDVHGALPLGVAGQLAGIGRDGVLHSFGLHSGRVSYFARSIRTIGAVKELVAFEGSILAYGEDSSVHQLSIGAGEPHRVDLAGPGRTVLACPRYDPASGELHLVARDSTGAQTHVVVPAGALTRRTRAIADAPAAIRGLAIGGAHLVFLADGAAGVTPRDSEMHITWMPTDVAAPQPLHSHRVGDSIIVLAMTPALERWTLQAAGGALEREVLDPTPRHLAHISDLDAGWLVGFVHDPSSTTTDLLVRDANHITAAPAATVRIPRPIPHGLRFTWIPATHHQTSPPKEHRP